MISQYKNEEYRNRASVRSCVYMKNTDDDVTEVQVPHLPQMCDRCPAKISPIQITFNNTIKIPVEGTKLSLSFDLFRMKWNILKEKQISSSTSSPTSSSPMCSSGSSDCDELDISSINLEENPIKRLYYTAAHFIDATIPKQHCYDLRRSFGRIQIIEYNGRQITLQSTELMIEDTKLMLERCPDVKTEQRMQKLEILKSYL